MPVPAGTWARLEMFFTGMEKQWSNIYWFTSVSTPPGTWDIKAATVALHAPLIAALLPILSSSVTCRGSSGTFNVFGSSRGVDYYHDDPCDGSGTPLPEDVAVVIQEFSDTGGRSGRGRLFISGVDTNNATGSYVNATGIGLFATFIAARKAAVTNQTMVWSPAVHSKKLNALHALVDCGTVSLIGKQTRRKTRF